jgi:hypothetical protein
VRDCHTARAFCSAPVARPRAFQCYTWRPRALSFFHHPEAGHLGPFWDHERRRAADAGADVGEAAAVAVVAAAGPRPPLQHAVEEPDVVVVAAASDVEVFVGVVAAADFGCYKDRGVDLAAAAEDDAAGGPGRQYGYHNCSDTDLRYMNYTASYCTRERGTGWERKKEEKIEDVEGLGRVPSLHTSTIPASHLCQLMGLEGVRPDDLLPILAIILVVLIVAVSEIWPTSHACSSTEISNAFISTYTKMPNPLLYLLLLHDDTAVHPCS